MSKIEAKEILKRIRSKEKPEKANVTFRLSTNLMDNFKKACAKQGVTPTAVLEEMIQSFLQSL
ncbi:MAG: hypothetical protein KF681_16005 [Bdellovibrionaceae bacterium]|nr:hypothetical protein [Pseudobdellovibrionaceae bacterium]